MPRKKFTSNDLPYLSVQVRSRADLLVAVTSNDKQTPNPLSAHFGATMRVGVGVDRLAVATTLVEVARDLIKDHESLNYILSEVSGSMVKVQMSSGDRFKQRMPDDTPF